eukprot:6110162-Prymnesium_polylepis.1
MLMGGLSNYGMSTLGFGFRNGFVEHYWYVLIPPTPPLFAPNMFRAHPLDLSTIGSSGSVVVVACCNVHSA